MLALVVNKLVAPKSRSGERRTTYESGMEPEGGAWIQFNIRYYMFALVFVIFDVETVFLYPWAVAFHRLGLLAFIEALGAIAGVPTPATRTIVDAASLVNGIDFRRENDLLEPLGLANETVAGLLARL